MHCSGHFKPILVYKGDRFKKGFRQSGNDRDEYVANNNGGFTVAHAPSTQLKPSTTYVAQFPRGFNSLGIDKTVRNNVKAHMVIYRQNGTGRDSYITSNNGGFCIQEGSNEFCGYQESFKRSLRKYAPVATRPQKTVSSQSPARNKQMDHSIHQTLNRFKIYMKQRGESVDATDEQDGKPVTQTVGAEAQSRQPKMGHYRTQSQTINQETTERIQEYLKQRQAYSRAQALHKSLSQNSAGGGSSNRNGSLSCGKLFPSDKANRSRNPIQAKCKTVRDVGGEAAGGNKTQNEASLVLAIKSTPSLNNAFGSTAKSRKTSVFLNTTNHQKEMPTGLSDQQTSFDHRNATLNVVSQDNLDMNQTGDMGQQHTKSRPMTTKLGGRRNTFQPEAATLDGGKSLNLISQEVQGIYERHGSPNKTAMQMFNEHQKSTCARLSVPHERRRRERFNGTQNTFGTMALAEGEGGAFASFNDNIFGARQRSNGSVGSGTGARVKSSLMGTSARQKLLKYRLAIDQAKNETTQDQKAQIATQIADLANLDGDQKEFDHIRDVDVREPAPLTARVAKRDPKERRLEHAYRTQKPAVMQGVASQTARQALKANLRHNLNQLRQETPNNFGRRTHSLQVGATAVNGSSSLM